MESETASLLDALSPLNIWIFVIVSMVRREMALLVYVFWALVTYVIALVTLHKILNETALRAFIIEILTTLLRLTVSSEK